MKRPLRIVCMGGGTGLPQLLSGFKLLSREPEYRDEVVLAELTALVTAFDDGGSSGRIVETYHTLPPGDLRNCLIALSDERTEPLLTHFFNHRFREDEDEALAGHSAGNLLLLTLSQVYGGDLRKALLAIRRILPIQSTLLFPTLSPAILCAELSDGTLVEGESRLASRDVRYPVARIFLKPREPQADASEHFPPMDGVLESIARADIITLGPGSLYTSILPHFLVDGISEAVRKSRAKKVYICNLMTESGETDGFRVADHVQSLQALAGIELDMVVANDAPVPSLMRRAYERERMQTELKKTLRALERAFELGLENPKEGKRLGAEATRAHEKLQHLSHQLCHPEATFVQVLPQLDEALPAGVQLVTDDLLAHVVVEKQGGGTKKVIRHDPLALARTIVKAMKGLPDFPRTVEPGEEPSGSPSSGQEWPP